MTSENCGADEPPGPVFDSGMDDATMTPHVNGNPPAMHSCEGCEYRRPTPIDEIDLSAVLTSIHGINLLADVV